MDNRFEEHYKLATTSFNFKSLTNLQVKTKQGLISRTKRETKENKNPGPGSYAKPNSGNNLADKEFFKAYSFSRVERM